MASFSKAQNARISDSDSTGVCDIRVTAALLIALLAASFYGEVLRRTDRPAAHDSGHAPESAISITHVASATLVGVGC